MSDAPSFAELAAAPDTAPDVLTLALAAEFRDVDAAKAIASWTFSGRSLRTPPSALTETRSRRHSHANSC